MLRTQDIRRRFDKVAVRFDDADFVHATTRAGIVSRLAPVLIDATTILDLGCATGAMGRAIRKRFRAAHVVSLDLSQAMLSRARRQKPWLAKASFVQGDARHLPFAGASFDLVVANQLLPWTPDPRPVFTEVARILRKGGCFAFATLGPDSLREIDAAWRTADDGPHVVPFADMHDIGDALVGAGLCNPVLDVDRLRVSYESAGKLFADLAGAGARNALADRRKTLTGKERFQAMTAALSAAGQGGRITLELECVYGHCWGAGRSTDTSIVGIDASAIPVRR
jgi:malonyl-CoA O-methyltransferase